MMLFGQKRAARNGVFNNEGDKITLSIVAICEHGRRTQKIILRYHPTLESAALQAQPKRTFEGVTSSNPLLIYDNQGHGKHTEWRNILYEE